MDGDRRGDGNAQGHVVHGRGKRGDTFRKIVYADCQCGHYAHAHELRVAGLLVHLLDHVCLVGVFERGDEPVDDADEQYPGEEAGDGDDNPRLCAPFVREGGVRLLEQLDERYVDHHAARQAQRERQQPLVGAAGKESDGAADAGGQSGAQRQQQGYEDIVFHRVYRSFIWLYRRDDGANGREERKLPIVRVRFIFCKDSAFPVNTVKNRALSEPGFSDRSITSAYSECCFRQAFVRPSADMPVRRCGAAGLADGMPRPVICCALRGSARPALRCCRP